MPRVWEAVHSEFRLREVESNSASRNLCHATILHGRILRNVQKFLTLQGVEVTHQTVYNWIRKYTERMEKYLDQLTPQVSNTWRADEIFLKVKGNMKYLYALMDDETRFWIAKRSS